MARVSRSDDENGKYASTFDQSEGGRFSVLGPLSDDGGRYVARDHENDVELGRGSRRDMIALIEAQDPAEDYLS